MTSSIQIRLHQSQRLLSVGRNDKFPHLTNQQLKIQQLLNVATLNFALLLLLFSNNSSCDASMGFRVIPSKGFVTVPKTMSLSISPLKLPAFM